MKTLIVDDEAISRTILADILAPLGTVMATGRGRNAVRLYRQALDASIPFDLILLDISMPDMDGREVLRSIRQLEKSVKVSRPVKVVVASARMNRSVIRECIDCGCNDYVTKPVSESRLLKRLRKIGLQFRDPARRVETKIHPKVVETITKKFYRGGIRLPVLPGIVGEIQAVLSTGDPSVEDLVSAVEKDIVVSGKLVRIANSPLYRGVSPVTDLKAAVVRLGMEATHSAVSAISSKLLFDSDNASLKKIFERHWSHSFATACCGRLIAEKIGLANSDTVFLMGITCDLGNVLLMKAISDLSPDTGFEDPELLKAIHEIHTTFGAALLKKWKFPDIFVRMAEIHHWNEFPPGTETEISVIHLADFLAGVLGYGFPGFEITSTILDNDADKGVSRILKTLGQPPDTLIDMMGEARGVIEASRHAF